MTTVSDASPLIALEQIGHLDLFKRLFREILIPDEVAKEIVPTVRRRSWIQQCSLSRPLLAETVRRSLGPGERAAISLAAELRAETIILDDEAGRRIATQVGLPVMGTAGALLMAKERGVIATVRPYLDALLAKRFFLAPRVYEVILSKAGES